MSRNKFKQVFIVVIAVSLLSTAILGNTASALSFPVNSNWFTLSDTNVAAVAVGDVNGDGINETVTAGYFNDGSHWNAQLTVWNSASLAIENQFTWLWGSGTTVTSVAIGNVTGSSVLDIVTGGSWFDGTSWHAQLIDWNGSTLVPEHTMQWLWGSGTTVTSVAIGNVTRGAGLDIVTGGSWFDGTSWHAQLIDWNGATLVPEQIFQWMWGSGTVVNSVAIGNVTRGAGLDIVTGGSWFDGTSWHAQLIDWNGATLVPEQIFQWLWGSGTVVNSVAIGNVTRGAGLDIVTGGSWFDGTSWHAQLIDWNGATLVPEQIFQWMWGTGNVVNSIAIGNVTGGAGLDIVTGGNWFDGANWHTQLIIWNGATLVPEATNSWLTTANTHIDSVALGKFGGTTSSIVTGGGFYDSIRANAQLYVFP